MSNHDENKLGGMRTDLNSMSDENKDGIDIELAKSIEKLVEEETNVAKASMENKDFSVPENERQTETAKMTTQILPDLVDIQIQARKAELEKQTKIVQKEKVVSDRRDISDRKNVSDKKLSQATQIMEPIKEQEPKNILKKKKIILYSTAAVIIVIIAALVITLTVSNHKTYSYNYSKAMELLKKQDYHNAKHYFIKAYQTGEGKKSTDVLYALYQCYQQDKEEQQAKDMLLEILSIDKNNENALSELARIYFEKADGDSLNSLIAEYRGKETEKVLLQYEVQIPTASETSGQYQKEIQVFLFAEDSCNIYYTVDGSNPDKNSTLYEETIRIEGGNTVIKAIAVNKIGVQSDVAEFEYAVNYQKPDSPVINPSSGVYDVGEEVSIEAADGMKIYYTTDGTTPTTASELYVKAFLMPEGNTVVSAIAVDEHDMISSVARKNYIVNPQKTYTYTEALEILKDRMKDLGILNSDGQTAPNGAAAVFTYESGIVVDEVELYMIRFDLKENSQTITQGHYGVGIKNAKCYRITGTEGAYEAASY